MKAKELQKEFEDTGYSSWINSDIYPDGRIYTKEYTEWLEEKVKEKNKNFIELLRLEKPWSLMDLINKLAEGCDILLNQKNYDGHGWEEISHSVKEAKESVLKINELLSK